MSTHLLEHLSPQKQGELGRITKTIKKTLRDDIGVEMIILFGSYARGDYVEQDLVQEGHTLLEYKSDFDILVVTQKPTQEKNMRYTRELNDLIHQDKLIDSPVSIIIEDIHHINAKLEENRYFYLDIKREGIVLYDSGKYQLSDARELTTEEKHAMQQEDYTTRFTGGQEFFSGYEHFLGRGYHNGAAFMLHQATEKCMTAYMLVKTSYKPKTHDLLVLYEQIKELDEAFENRFDLTPESPESTLFTLLKKAYVDARYSKTYTITPTQLQQIAQKVLILQSIVQERCTHEMQQT